MSVNKVILVGNVGRDPEVRHLDNDRVVANFSLATRETYRDRNGQRQELTEWHTIELWDDLARTAEKYVKKGKLIYLEGKIRTNTWTDKESGLERSAKIIRCNVMTFLNTGTGGHKEGSEHSSSEHTSSNENEEQGDDLPF
ncbi:MAG: single-stranded DNA-binding protein [Bacteroidetes bacterium]|nr:single-stranded DNA-binding protein [Bacteroidota bacterium]